MRYFDCVVELNNRTKVQTHSCMQYGFWCWKQILKEPKSITFFIRKKLRDVLRRL